MPSKKVSYQAKTDSQSSVVHEDNIEYGIIGTLQGLKYEYRPNNGDWRKNTFEVINQLSIKTDIPEEARTMIRDSRTLRFERSIS